VLLCALVASSAAVQLSAAWELGQDGLSAAPQDADASKKAAASKKDAGSDKPKQDNIVRVPAGKVVEEQIASTDPDLVILKTTSAKNGAASKDLDPDTPFPNRPANVKLNGKKQVECTEEDTGKLVFRDMFYGCQIRTRQVCKECNCVTKDVDVFDKECNCHKKVQKQVCSECCTSKSAPEWIALTACERKCDIECDCKTDKNGIRLCSTCCKEVCGPKWAGSKI